MPFTYPYRLIRSNRKSISASLSEDGILLVRIPQKMSDRQAERFLVENEHRLTALIERVNARRAQLPEFRAEDIPALKARAEEILPQKLRFFAQRMGVSPSACKITSAKKRFGSCNSKKSICFSCFLMLFPEEAIDYVIVHELAHLKEMNHSSRFYEIVRQVLPDYRKREAMLKGEIQNGRENLQGQQD